jgi:hypothetical protein
MICYLSGPMTGIKNFNHPAFEREKTNQESKGNIVISPHMLPLGLDYNAYMDIALAQIRAADCIVMLEGWENSKGAMGEFHYARAIGLDKQEEAQP